MASVRDIAGYLCRNYPYQEQLSKARLTKMIYLADWKSAIDRSTQISDVRWEFSHFGPYVPLVVEQLREDEDFWVRGSSTIFGHPKEVVSYHGPDDFPTLSAEDRRILDFVIASVAPKSWDGFIKLVYSTYPVVSQPRYSELDLVRLAEEYRGQEALLGGPAPG
jgi:Protein of unknown function (DUF4065)